MRWMLSVGVLVCVGGLAGAQDEGPEPEEAARRGVVMNEDGAFQGYTLFTSLMGTTTFLMDMHGQIVHQWETDVTPGQSEYLLDNGHLLRCVRDGESNTFRGGGMGGAIREYDWEGNLVWEYLHASDEQLQHHDIELLPNGNVLLIAWELKSNRDALLRGKDPSVLRGGGFWPDAILEVKPIRPKGGEIVWEWHAWDHLIQNVDPSLDNHGEISEHPELIDINGGREVNLSAEDLAAMKALGYISSDQEEEEVVEPEEEASPRGRGGRGGPGRGGQADWLHVNAVDYNPALDQILISIHNLHEIWIIDHSTTSEEAAGHEGGRYGRGGDLLYRWGNPMIYHAAGPEDQVLNGQHDAQWIPEGLYGEGDILVFNNNAGGGRGRGEQYSAVVQITPPILEDGTYEREEGLPYGPWEPTWTFQEDGLYSSFISGVQRLPNDNTLICSGAQGRLLEVDPEGNIHWDFWNAFQATMPQRPGGPGGPGGGFPGAGGGRGGEGGPPEGGEGRGAGRTRFGTPPDGGEGADGQEGRPQRPGGFPGGGIPGGGTRGGGMRGGGFGGGPGGPGGGMGNGMFRATRIAPDHPGLKGRELKPLEKQPELVPERPVRGGRPGGGAERDR